MSSSTGDELNVKPSVASHETEQTYSSSADSASSKRAWQPPALERLHMSATASRSGTMMTDGWINNRS